ncbi:MAG: ATP synthase F1 subunit delta [Clostridia bacterium]|jgi:F-type H+-transporting ATPase subunit delta
MEMFSADILADALIAGKEKVHCKQLEEITSAFHRYPELLRIMAEPKISIEEKKNCLEEVVHDPVDRQILNLFILLASDGRIHLLDSIYQKYLKRTNREDGVLTGKVFSAFEMDDRKIHEIERRFEKYFNKAIRLSLELDKNLIGGIQVIIGDMVFGGSIRGQLLRLKEYMLNE